MGHESAQHLYDDPHSEQSGDVGGVVRRRHFDDLQAANPLGGYQTEKLQRFSWQKTTGSGQPVPGTDPQSTESTSNEI